MNCLPKKGTFAGLGSRTGEALGIHTTGEAHVGGERASGPAAQLVLIGS